MVGETIICIEEDKRDDISLLSATVLASNVVTGTWRVIRKDTW